MVNEMKERFFQWFVYGVCGHRENCVLPWWGVGVRFALFPLKTFYHLMAERTGYNIMTDSWRIHGLTISGKFFRYHLARPGARFEVVAVDKASGLVTIRDLDRGRRQ